MSGGALSPLPPRSGGEGFGVGGLSANSSANECAETPPTPDPSPPRAARAGGGEKKPFVGRIGAHRVRAERGPMAAKSADHDPPYEAELPVIEQANITARLVATIKG